MIPGEREGHTFRSEIEGLVNAFECKGHFFVQLAKILDEIEGKSSKGILAGESMGCWDFLIYGWKT